MVEDSAASPSASRASPASGDSMAPAPSSGGGRRHPVLTSAQKTRTRALLTIEDWTIFRPRATGHPSSWCRVVERRFPRAPGCRGAHGRRPGRRSMAEARCGGRAPRAPERGVPNGAIGKSAIRRGASLIVVMRALKAKVRHGRLVLDEPTDLPEGAVGGRRGRRRVGLPRAVRGSPCASIFLKRRGVSSRPRTSGGARTATIPRYSSSESPVGEARCAGVLIGVLGKRAFSRDARQLGLARQSHRRGQRSAASSASWGTGAPRDRAPRHFSLVRITHQSRSVSGGCCGDVSNAHSTA